MKLGLILGAAAVACCATLPLTMAQAGTQGLIVLAEDEHHKDQHPTGGPPHGAPPPAKAPPHGTLPAGPPNHTTGHGTMGGQNHMGGNAMMGRGPSRQNFDRHAYQRNFSSPRHYHVGVYVRPNGWYYHRWGYGEVLPAFFWTQNYWLGNYIDYGLAAPPYGFVWVRYGDDALLIDQNSGEVLQVDYGVFD